MCQTLPVSGANGDSASVQQQAQPDISAGGGDKGGFSSGSSGGADLNYTDDDLDSYSTIWDGAVTDSDDSDHERVVAALENVAE